MNKVEGWKAEKHGFDVWPDVVAHARAATPMAEIAEADLDALLPMVTMVLAEAELAVAFAREAAGASCEPMMRFAPGDWRR